MLNVLDLEKGQKIFIVDWCIKGGKVYYQINEREVTDVKDMGGGSAYVNFKDLDESISVMKYEVRDFFYLEKDADEFVKQRRGKEGKENGS
jgi:hypothetical protein